MGPATSRSNLGSRDDVSDAIWSPTRQTCPGLEPSPAQQELSHEHCSLLKKPSSVLNCASTKISSSTSLKPSLHLEMIATKLLFAMALLALATSASFSVAMATAATCSPTSCTLTAVKTQVCGLDGVTYSSMCDLELAKCATPSLQFASQGACASVATSAKRCDQECGDHESLICGSDGVTYLNACHFDRAYCRDRTLTPMGYGACVTSSSLRR